MTSRGRSCSLSSCHRASRETLAVCAVSGSMALGLFPMHPCSTPRATTSLQPLTTRKTSCTNHPTRKEQSARGLQSRGCSDICNIACLLSHSPLIDSPPVPRPAAAEHMLHQVTVPCALLLYFQFSSTGQCSYTRVCRSQITSWIFGKHFYRSPFHGHRVPLGLQYEIPKFSTIH